MNASHKPNNTALANVTRNLFNHKNNGPDDMHKNHAAGESNAHEEIEVAFKEIEQAGNEGQNGGWIIENFTGATSIPAEDCAWMVKDELIERVPADAISSANMADLSIEKQTNTVAEGEIKTVTSNAKLVLSDRAGGETSSPEDCAWMVKDEPIERVSADEISTANMANLSIDEQTNTVAEGEIETFTSDAKLVISDRAGGATSAPEECALVEKDEPIELIAGNVDNHADKPVESRESVGQNAGGSAYSVAEADALVNKANGMKGIAQRPDNKEEVADGLAHSVRPQLIVKAEPIEIDANGDSCSQRKIEAKSKQRPITWRSGIPTILLSDSEDGDEAKSKKVSLKKRTSNKYGRKKVYYVEDLLDHKQMEDGSFKYLVKWNGYDSTHNSWEPISSFDNPSALLNEYYTKIFSP